MGVPWDGRDGPGFLPVGRGYTESQGVEGPRLLLSRPPHPAEQNAVSLRKIFSNMTGSSRNETILHGMAMTLRGHLTQRPVLPSMLDNARPQSSSSHRRFNLGAFFLSGDTRFKRFPQPFFFLSFLPFFFLLLFEFPFKTRK